MIRNFFFSTGLLLILTSCFYPSCDDIIGKYYNIDEEGITHYVEIKEDGTYTQYYKNDSIEKVHESTWQWIADSHCTIQLWEWHVYKASEIDEVFDEELGSARANMLFFVNEQDLRISPNSNRAFIRTEFVKEIKQRRAAQGAYWATKDTLYYENGVIKEIGKLDAGKKYGNWQFFYKTGELESEGIMVYDKPAFLWKYYYKNGNLKTIGAYENSGTHPKIGPWEYYYKNGNLKEKGIYTYLAGEAVRVDNWEKSDTTGKVIDVKKYPSRVKYYDSLLKSPEFNYTNEERITKKRNEWIESEDQYYLKYKASLKDTVH